MMINNFALASFGVYLCGWSQ